MTLNFQFETIGDKPYFIFNNRRWELLFCTICNGEWVLSCDCGCNGTSCNGGGCKELRTATEEWWKLSIPLSNLQDKTMIARRKQEKEDYTNGVRYISFFDHLGVDWENGEKPKRWN